jgi:hypothetical protein
MMIKKRPITLLIMASPLDYFILLTLHLIKKIEYNFYKKLKNQNNLRMLKLKKLNIFIFLIILIYFFSKFNFFKLFYKNPRCHEILILTNLYIFLQK